MVGCVKWVGWVYMRLVCLGSSFFIYWDVEDVIYLCVVLSIVMVEGRCVCLNPLPFGTFWRILRYIRDTYFKSIWVNTNNSYHSTLYTIG